MTIKLTNAEVEFLLKHVNRCYINYTNKLNSQPSRKYEASVIFFRDLKHKLESPIRYGSGSPRIKDT